MPRRGDGIPLYDVLAAGIRQARSDRSWSQAELAEAVSAAGITWSQAIVSDIETGRRRLTVEELVALMLILRVPLVWLLWGGRPPESAPVRAGQQVLGRDDLASLATRGRPSGGTEREREVLELREQIATAAAQVDNAHAELAAAQAMHAHLVAHLADLAGGSEDEEE